MLIKDEKVMSLFKAFYYYYYALIFSVYAVIKIIWRLILKKLIAFLRKNDNKLATSGAFYEDES